MNKKKMEEKRKEYDFDQRMAELKEEEERQKEYKKEKKKVMIINAFDVFCSNISKNGCKKY